MIVFKPRKCFCSFCMLDRLHGFFAVPSFRLLAFLLLAPLPLLAFFPPGDPRFGFLDSWGYCSAFLLLAFFPLSREILRVFALLLFIAFFCLLWLYLQLFSLAFGGV